MEQDLKVAIRDKTCKRKDAWAVCNQEPAHLEASESSRARHKICIHGRVGFIPSCSVDPGHLPRKCNMLVAVGNSICAELAEGCSQLYNMSNMLSEHLHGMVRRLILN